MVPLKPFDSTECVLLVVRQINRSGSVFMTAVESTERMRCKFMCRHMCGSGGSERAFTS